MSDAGDPNKNLFLANDFKKQMAQFIDKCFRLGESEGVIDMMVIALAENPDATTQENTNIAWVNSTHCFGPQVFRLIKQHLVEKYHIPEEAVRIQTGIAYQFCPHCGKELK